MLERLAWSIPQAAEIIGISRTAAYQAAAAREIPVIRREKAGGAQKSSARVA